MPPINQLLQRAPSNVCDTPDCLAASAFVQQFVKLTVDPCSDFYEYSCGAWISALEGQDISKSTFADVTNRDTITLVGIMESSYDDFMSKHLRTNADGFNAIEQADTDRANFQKVKDYYDVCLVPERNAAELYPDIAYVKNTLLSATPETISEQLGHTLAYFTQRGISTFLNVFILLNNEDHEYNMAFITSSVLAPESDQDIELAITTVLGLDNQTQYELDASQQSGLQLWSQSEIKTAITTYNGIQAQLASIKDLSPGIDPLNIPLNGNLGELIASSSAIDWTAFFSDMADPEYVSNPATPIQYYQNYLQAVEKLLTSLTLRELQYFFVVRFVMDAFSDGLFKTDISGELVPDSSNVTVRQMACATEVGRIWYNSIGRFFALETIGGINEKNDIDKFINEFQTSWLNHLPGTPWLDEQTKAKAIEKVNALEPRAALNLIDPDWTNPGAIQSYYEKLQVDTTSHYKFLSNVRAWASNKDWENISNKVLKVEWSKLGYTTFVNAYYLSQYNQFEVPEGILQRGFYDSKFPSYLNYGGLGSVIGHELTHALDNEGRHFNASGYKEDWWTSSSNEAFDTRSQCFIDQYNKDFIVNESTGEKIYVNGTTTLPENLADSGGLSIALLAYREHIKQLGQAELLLPGFEHLTPEQMFFIGYGTYHCSVRDKHLTGYDPTDPHAPGVYRTRNVVINNADFAKAFNCPAGSPMNPHKSDADRCVVW